MLVVPLQPIPNQTLQVQLNGQACTLDVFQYAYGLFMSVTVGDTLIIATVLCENDVLIVRNSYLGFIGDFIFFDTQGTQNPDYTGLGGAVSRYKLIYLFPAEIAGVEL